MTYGRMLVVTLVWGVCVGLALCAIACLARNSLDAAAHMNFESSVAWMYIGAVLVGGLVGAIMAMAFSRLTEESGWMLWLAIGVLALTVVATSVGLECVFQPKLLRALAPTTIVAGVVAALMPAMRAWYEA